MSRLGIAGFYYTIVKDIQSIKQLLDRKVAEYNQTAFVEKDPVSVPHRFSKRPDIEIAGLFAAVLAWGNRTTIINNCLQLLEAMDYAPHQFITGFVDSDLKPLLSFVHRTFNATDLFGFLHFLQFHYHRCDSLELAFSQFINRESTDIAHALTGFHDYFFSVPDIAERTRKHVATPRRNSACKRLNMYLRWMVRKDSNGVDFGLWNNISPAQLICPLDVHVGSVARRLGLLERPQDDWKAAQELTVALRVMDPNDPVKYDFALFGMGVEERF